jgi:ABC-type transporter Mla subunit MlaD
MMTQEQRLDRLERMLLLVVKAGARERKSIRKRMDETDDKIDALIDAQIRTEEALTTLAHSQADLTRGFATTDERVNALINTVERLINERRDGKP